MSTFNNIGNESNKNFLNNIDTNKDQKITIAEIKKAMDADNDNEIENTEFEAFAQKAKAAGFNKDEIKILLNTQGKVDTSIELFNVTDSTWTATENIPTLAKENNTSIPSNSDALPSRKIEALTKSQKGVFHVQEQVNNSCGTTSLSMVLKYFQGHTLENSVPTIDKYIRAEGKLEIGLPNGKINSYDIDGYTSPRDIKKYAHQHGMRAGIQNNSSIAELKGMLDKGVPCLCFTDWNFDENTSTSAKGANPDGKSLHWVAAIGYKYKENPVTKVNELMITVANPHGHIQDISASDFDHVWRGSDPSGIMLNIKNNTSVKTEMQRLYVAMVPKDETAKIIGPDGKTRKAGEIRIPTDNDGIQGKLAQMGSTVIKFAGSFQEELGRIGSELNLEANSGYKKDGLKGAVKNLIIGDKNNVEQLRNTAMKGTIKQKAEVINELMNLPFTREIHENLIYDIMKSTSMKDFPQLIQLIDMRQLAHKLEKNKQAGNVAAWIAKAEVDSTGKTGPKFEAFSDYIASKQRKGAAVVFMNNEYTQKYKLMDKIPNGVMKDLIKDFNK